MKFSNIPHMERQKLVILERVQHDVGRFTNPVFNLFVIAAAIYLPCYAKLMLFSSYGTLDPLSVLLALSAIALVLMTPAFALAATVEVYFASRIAKASRASRSIEIA
ncbi:hypothetical protein [Salipiger aestuarii]|uniref:hypothetical protein n=1 Tax=Salipiger aestuarii TaxID=568098 RepID=UPI001239C619|nr:hypothetical protein [Salipiger aestuarii]